MPTSPSQPLPSTRYHLENAALGMLRWVVPKLSWDGLYAIGDLLGLALYAVGSERRRVATEALLIAFGDHYSPAQRRVLARRSCQHLMKTMLEFLRLPELSVKQIEARVPVTGMEHLAQAHALGRGTIVITPHLGNWEYMSARVCAAGFPLVVIGRDSGNPTVARAVASLRRSVGAEALPKFNSLRQVLGALRENKLVGILPDQHAGMAGIMLELFGRRTPIHPIPALLARRMGCPIVPGAVSRDAENHLSLHFAPALFCPRTDDRQADVANCMREVVGVIETMVRRHPDQWLWIHKRFRDTDSLLEQYLD